MVDIELTTLETALWSRIIALPAAVGLCNIACRSHRTPGTPRPRRLTSSGSSRCLLVEILPRLSHSYFEVPIHVVLEGIIKVCVCKVAGSFILRLKIPYAHSWNGRPPCFESSMPSLILRSQSFSNASARNFSINAEKSWDFSSASFTVLCPISNTEVL